MCIGNFQYGILEIHNAIPAYLTQQPPEVFITVVPCLGVTAPPLPNATITDSTPYTLLSSKLISAQVDTIDL
jgi:hypothetical protein